MKIKKDDEVIVIAGKYKGAKGKVLRAIPSESKVVVAGVARIKKHIKPTKESPGRIDDVESPIHVSNVALFDSKSKKPSRVGYKIEGDKKVRVLKKSGEKVEEGKKGK